VSTAAARAGRAPWRPSAQPARLVVRVGLGCLSLVTGVMLVASQVPSETLTGRLLRATSETRTGTYTQELQAHLDERLRFAGLLLVALTVALVLVRGAVEDLIASCLKARAGPLQCPARRVVLEIALPMALAVGLRAVFLNQPMRYDEALSFNEFASRPLYYGLSFYPDPNNHLLNTLLVHILAGALGNQPWVLRLPAFLGGVLLVPATYALGRLLYGRGSAVVGATLVAVTSYIVEYSTNSRGYTLQALAFVVVVTLVMRAGRRGSLSALGLAAVVSAAGAYALPTMLYGVAIAAAMLILARPSTTIRPAHLVASGLVLGLFVVVLYLPVMLVSGPDKLLANRFVVSLAGSELAAELPRSLGSTWALWNRDIPLPLVLVLIAGFVVASARDLRSLRVPPGVLAAGVCLVLVLVQRVAPFERVWLFLMPLYLVVAGAGLALFIDGRLVAILFGAILGYTTLSGGSILRSTETGAFPDAEAVTRTLTGRLAAQDAVITQVPASLPELQYYFARAGLPIDVLVRPPDAAARVYAVVPVAARPLVDGWGEPRPIQRFAGSDLVELGR
jgi:Dolichyl-phosphate-mannose-protein mannosyltransferase